APAARLFVPLSGPEILRYGLEGGTRVRELHREAAAIAGTRLAQLGDRSLDHRLAPAHRARGRRPVSGARDALRLHLLDVFAQVVARAAVGLGHAADVPAAHVAIQRLRLDAQNLQRFVARQIVRAPGFRSFEGLVHDGVG